MVTETFIRIKYDIIARDIFIILLYEGRTKYLHSGPRHHHNQHTTITVAYVKRMHHHLQDIYSLPNNRHFPFWVNTFVSALLFVMPTDRLTCCKKILSMRSASSFRLISRHQCQALTRELAHPSVMFQRLTHCSKIPAV